MPLRPVPVNLEELATALTSDPSFLEEAYFLDQETGEILILPENFPRIPETEVDEAALMTGVPEEEITLRLQQARENPRRFIRIEPLPPWESYDLMEKFVDSLPPGRVQDRLAKALTRRRPFRRFKDVLLDYPKVREQWFAFQDEHLHRWAREWLAAYGLRPLGDEDDEAAEQGRADSTDTH